MPRRTALAIAPSGNYLDYPSCMLRETFESYSNGLEYKILYGEEATPENVRKAILELDPLFVAGVGHGQPCIYTVYNKEPFLVMESNSFEKCTAVQNLDLVKGRIWQLESCYVGKELGKAMVENYGALGYAGAVSEILFFVGEPPCYSRASRAVFIPEFEFSKRVLLGYSTKQAQEYRMKAYDREIFYWLENSAFNPYSDLIVRLLQANKLVSVYYGEDYRLRDHVIEVVQGINTLDAVILLSGVFALLRGGLNG